MGLFSGNDDDDDDDSASTDDNEDRSLVDRVSDKVSEVSEEGYSALTDHYTVRIQDYRDVEWDLREKSASMRLDSDTLEFEQQGLIGKPNSFSIPVDKIDFQNAEVWSREDHETENLNRLVYDDDHWSKGGERVFLKLPLHAGSYITISMSDKQGGLSETNPNTILREIGDIAGFQLEARHARSNPTQTFDSEENDGDEPGPLDQLERLKELRDEGAITEEEFEDKKEDLLDQI